jgi:hypothetical protein
MTENKALFHRFVESWNNRDMTGMLERSPD